VLFIGGAVFVLLWVARRRAASGPASPAARLIGTPRKRTVSA
jgi:hypothetical protein